MIVTNLDFGSDMEEGKISGVKEWISTGVKR